MVTLTFGNMHKYTAYIFSKDIFELPHNLIQAKLHCITLHFLNKQFFGCLISHIFYRKYFYIKTFMLLDNF